MSLTLHSLSKSFGSTLALDSVSLEVAAGETLAILGPSGCGKSTLLAIIAGLEIPDAGDVLWEGRSLRAVPPHRRGFGLMFQDYALFPHLSVAKNVAFGLKMARLPAPAARARVAEMLEMVGLPGFSERDVNTLSGGEQQRVALARALAPRPRLLMLDEPLGSLDRALRERLTVELRSILRGIGQTAIYVTHDQEEAFALADRVAVLNRGRVEQTGSPQEIYSRPASVFVAQFLGMNNLLEGVMRREGNRWQVKTALGDFPWAGEGAPAASDAQPGVLLLRPDSARLGGAGNIHFTARLVETAFRGSQIRAAFEAGGVTLSFDLPASIPLPPVGAEAQLGFDSTSACHWFPAL